jgi:hypothetical protein
MGVYRPIDRQEAEDDEEAAACALACLVPEIIGGLHSPHERRCRTRRRAS